MIALPPDADLDALEAEIRAEAAEIHARTARLAARLARFDELDGWRGYGLRDCADWVVCNLGFDRPNARALMLAAGVAREFPEVGEAFSAGELSFDKLRLLGAGVIAAPDEQSEWVDVARTSSAPELARRCREVRNERRTGPERDRAQRVQRRLRAWYDSVVLLSSS
ncbi:MAG TPA: DUF222 domain-containing protein [Candidatus Dormibacteraeota bacterium]|nr:DUF222 domain-containing protein [Candidatus Dormibacteraeota bacterium]